MPLIFECLHCQTAISVKYLQKGEMAKCKNCGKEVIVPQDALGTTDTTAPRREPSISNVAEDRTGTSPTPKISNSVEDNISDDQKENLFICPSCNSKQVKSSKYCDQCGAMLFPKETKIIAYCDVCNAEYGRGSKYCVTDGSKLIEKEKVIEMSIFSSANDPPLKAEPDKSALAELADGDYGLAKTYWVFGVLVGIIVNIIIRFVESSDIAIILFVSFMAYEVPVLLGTWRAAKKYSGPSIWVVMTKIAVGLSWLSWVLGFILFFSLINA